MKPIVGIRSLFSGISKRDLLLVDQIHLVAGWNSWQGFEGDERAADFDYLEEKGALVRVPDEAYDEAVGRLSTRAAVTEEVKGRYDRRIAAMVAEDTGEGFSATTFEIIATRDALRGRLYALGLQCQDNVQPISLLDDLSELTLPDEAQSVSRKNAVIELALKAFPVPADDVPLEQLLDFRQDDDARDKLTALRHWMSKMARGSSSPSEIAEELESLLFEYERNMKLHRLKYEQNTFQALLTIPFKVLEELLRFKFGAALETIFAVRRHHLDLMQAELTVPGKELAYVSRARASFKQGDLP